MFYGCVIAVCLTMFAAACTPGVESVDGQSAPEKSISTSLESAKQVFTKLATVAPDDVDGNKKIVDTMLTGFDPSIDAQHRDKFIELMAAIASLDKNSKIEIDPALIKIDGDIATIQGRDAKITIQGEVQDSSSDDGRGVITLKKSGPNWLISDFVTPPLTQEELDEYSEDTTEEIYEYSAEESE